MTSILTLASLFVGLCVTFYISFSLINQLLHPFMQRSFKSPEEDRMNRLVDDVMQAGSSLEYHQSTAVVSCEVGVNSVCPETVESTGHLAEGIGSFLERIGGFVGHLGHWH
ncbi:hypothetical protein HC931_27255 [Candidatus Gracilibacteria bacterium]|nr:hypothetical protein [Candidatus Gracilibacteria bacterium]NJM88241.1 hypothetical protein [Hydrococcus sp. RU_2_2]NJP18139.1 hypothetical protein [Hydrococcus sp. CRU_1_1]NJQ98338.1 hypothetical protein [Hydrococcus sp. CSU_1_8]